jgi:hypothetical protein
MSFAKPPERRPASGRLGVARAPPTLLLRALFFGALAIAGAAWALVRHCSYVPPPLRVPVAPREAPTYDADAGEVPVPEWLESDGGVR